MNIKLAIGNCLEVMKNIPDKSVDMILCDLPYGTTACKWDSVIPFEPLWAEYKRVAKDNAAIVLFAAQPFGSYLVTSNPKTWKQTLIWKKNCASNFLNANRQHLAIHEEVHLFSFGKSTYNPQKHSGKPYKNKRTGKDDSGDCYGDIKVRLDTENSGDRFPTTILEFSRETGKHPTQKPVALLEYLIKTYSNEGDTVLDNTMGSGSTGIAAFNLNRNFIGIEQDPTYFEVAVKRFLDHDEKTKDIIEIPEW